MNTALHPVAPEDVMALIDGELPAAQAQAISTHIDHCAECANFAAQFRATSESLSRWTVPVAPPRLDEAVLNLAAQAGPGRKVSAPSRLNLWDRRSWSFKQASALAAICLLLAAGVTMSLFLSARSSRNRQRAFDLASPAPNPGAAVMTDGSELKDPAYATAQPAPLMQSRATKLESPEMYANSTPLGKHDRAYGYADALSSASAAAPPPPAPPPAPMIARSVSLTILVKDVPASRASLDAILTRHHGYAGTLSVSTQENAARNFQASLRIPASELASSIAEMRGLGRVQVESQSGEEVTQQHTDLVARLQNARETEDRLRDLLAHHTGKIDEVLQVEEEIDRVRGEIEQMEADQKALEHRVDFATVELQLTEEYKEQLGSPSASVGTRMRNAFVAGLRHAAATLLGLFLFLEEFVPTLLIWLAILGIPAFFFWRRYRKAQRLID